MVIKRESHVKKSSVQSTFSPANIYLIAYNVLQFFGWFILLIQTGNHILTHGLNVQSLWKETGLELQIFQTLAILEIVHVIIGIVKSSVVTTTMQLFSRVFVVWGICYVAPISQGSIGLLFILIAWTITEVVRYSFYFLNILKIAPWILVYFRYTFFIVLYPMGVIGEQLLMYRALPYIAKRNMFSYALPNAFNFTFSYYYFVIGLMLSYIPLFPQLYLHMFSQRKKVLGPSETKKKN